MYPVMSGMCIYRVLAKLVPKGAPAYQNLLANRAQWEKLAEEGRKGSPE